MTRFVRGRDRRRCGRPAGAAILVVALLGALVPRPSIASPVPSPAPRIRTHVVDRSVSFFASETSRARIRFERPIPWTQVPHVHVHGQGRVYGFIMRRTGSYEQEAFRPYYKWVGSATCDTRACETDPAEHPGIAASSHGSPVEKLSGTWDVYVMADGAPVRVDFVVAGSRGRDEVRVTERVPSEVQTFTPTLHESASHTFYSGGGFTTLDDSDFAQSVVWVMGAPYAASVATLCSYMSEDEAPAEGAFLPQCPGGAEMLRLPLFDASAGERRQPVYSGGFVEGERGLGVWYAAAAAVEEFAAVGMWVDFPEI